MTVDRTPPEESSSADRFAWKDGDVQWLDEDGQPLTSRQVKEMQLIHARAQVEQDVAADTDPEGSGE